MCQDAKSRCLRMQQFKKEKEDIYGIKWREDAPEPEALESG